MLETIKKIVLFLFGIVLVAFGNKAALKTIFDKDEDKAGDKIPNLNETEIKEPLVTEEVEETSELPEPIEKPTVAKKQNVADKKRDETTQVKKAELKAEQSASKVEKVVESQASKVNKEPVKEVVEEKPVTTIEPEKSESASGTE